MIERKNFTKDPQLIVGRRQMLLEKSLNNRANDFESFRDLVKLLRVLSDSICNVRDALSVVGVCCATLVDVVGMSIYRRIIAL